MMHLKVERYRTVNRSTVPVDMIHMIYAPVNEFPARGERGLALFKAGIRGPHMRGKRFLR